MGTLLSFLPTGEAAGCVVSGTDGFDDLTAPAALPGTRCFYTQSFSGTGANGFVVDTQAVSEPNSYTANNGGTLFITLPFEPICTTAGDASCNGVHTYSAAIRMSQLPDTGQFWQYRLSSACTSNTNSACLSVDSLGVADYSYRGGGAGTTAPDFATLAIDTWYLVEFIISVDVDTDGVGSDANDEETSVITITELDTEVEQSAVVGGEQWGSGSNSDVIQLGTADTSTTADVFIDDFHAPSQDTISPGLRFCAVAAEDNFGFDYKEDVSFDDDGDPLNGIGLDDFYDFQEDQGGSSYLGKAFSPGSTSFAMLGRIEAADDAQTGIFRFAYTTGATVLTAGSAGDAGADMTASGNGQNTGNFANNIQLELTENGDTWIGRIRYSIGGGALTTISSSVLIPDPNVATLLNFTVDSEATTAIVYDDSGEILMARNLPAGLEGAVWGDAWFIATADAGLGDTKAALDNNDVGDSSGSTCIYDLAGTSTVVGSSGSEPGGSAPPGGGEGGGGFSELFDPDNIDSQLFIGFLLVAGMVFMGIRQGGGQAVIGSLFFVGLFLAYALGWMPLWVILVIFTISLAAIWVLPRQSKDGV